ncbi:MAG: LiaI-LiaF-like domain-containing protein [Blastocatellia bacterium]
MKCSYHPSNNAGARCQACERPLCPACDHRIKGFPYCQDCIVAGIEAIRRPAGAEPRTAAWRLEKSPMVALLFGFVPGMGAAYNGQNIKALVHFTITILLWTLSDIFSDPLETTFLLSCATFYFFSIYDAYTTAHRARLGADIAEEDNRLKNLLRERTNVWGGILIGIGALAMLDNLMPVIIHRYWPAVLIVIGLLFLWLYQRLQSSARFEPRDDPGFRTPPPSVIPPGFERPTAEFSRADSRYDR